MIINQQNDTILLKIATILQSKSKSSKFLFIKRFSQQQMEKSESGLK